MTLPSTSVLGLSRTGSTLTATIDDPASRNAMSDALITDLTTVLDATRGDRSYRTLVLRGNSRVFCAGADLKSDSLTETVDPGQDDPVVSLSKRGAAIYYDLNAHPLVVIAVVEGAAFGGGFGLACCADIIICGPNAKFALSETTLGLVPAQIAPFVIARLGLPTARRLSLTGSRFGPEEAMRIGLADHVCGGAGAVEDMLFATLAQINRCGPEANASTKLLLLRAANEPRNGFVGYAANVFAEALRGEGQEGIAAFVAKRDPRWVERL